MTDPPRRRSSSKAPPPTGDDLHAVSRRAAARIAPERRDQFPPALPAWPADSADGAARDRIAIPPPNAAEAADLTRGGLARPDLVGDVAGLPDDGAQADAVPPDPLNPMWGRGATGTPASTAPKRASALADSPSVSTTGPGVAAPMIAESDRAVADPRPRAELVDFGDAPSDGDHLAVSVPDPAVAASVPGVEPSTRTMSASIRTAFRVGPGSDDVGDMGEAPGVSGRLPALIAGLATASSTVGEVASPGGPASSPFGAGEDDFGLAPQASPFAGAGGAADLSRTNEILQQILDALRRSSAPSLDGAGPAEFAGRL